jgi:GNAT superfamily N-acetyltransferase
LDRALLQEWIARAPTRASGFEIGCWDGPLPEAELPAISKLFQVMNGMPRQDLEIEDELMPPDEIRGWERAMAARGMERWLMYAREKSTGEYAGFTEMFWNGNRPMILQQGGTGVWPQYRNRGLGRWLKAAMIERVLRERPQARLVRTDNADTNEAMLNINIQLGFKPFMESMTWQLETEKVMSQLGK